MNEWVSCGLQAKGLITCCKWGYFVIMRAACKMIARPIVS